MKIEECAREWKAIRDFRDLEKWANRYAEELMNRVHLANKERLGTRLDETGCVHVIEGLDLKGTKTRWLMGIRGFKTNFRRGWTWCPVCGARQSPSPGEKG